MVWVCATGPCVSRYTTPRRDVPGPLPRISVALTLTLDSTSPEKPWVMVASQLKTIYGQRLPAIHNPKPPPSQQQQLMVKDYRQLWKDVTSTSGEGEAIRTLADILRDGEGTDFILNLALEDAELCIEILDHVSRDPYLFPAFTVSDDFFRASQSTTSKPSRNRFFSSR